MLEQETLDELNADNDRIEGAGGRSDRSHRSRHSAEHRNAQTSNNLDYPTAVDANSDSNTHDPGNQPFKSIGNASNKGQSKTPVIEQSSE